MSISPDRRTRKRLATREAISDVATRLFLERGFDKVTIDEIAEAADVGRMTVFNHFPRKEDMFFDRDAEIRAVLEETVRTRAAGVAPIEAMRLLAHRLVAEHSPYVQVSDDSAGFIATIEASETLKARARALRDEIAEFMAGVLAQCVGRDAGDPAAHLAATVLLATWTSARIQAQRVFRQGKDGAEADALFLALVDRGSAGLAAAMAGTPYA